MGKPEANVTVKKVFVGGLKDDMDEESLKSHFSQYGSVTSVSIATEKETGNRRGFCFVEFDDYDAVDKVVREYFSCCCLSFKYVFEGN